jgi:hypothetical protein
MQAVVMSVCINRSWIGHDKRLKLSSSASAASSFVRQRSGSSSKDIARTCGETPTPRPTSIGMAGRHQSEQVADFSPE